jgi:hypothetical protein
MSLMTPAAKPAEAAAQLEIPVTAFVPCPMAKNFAQVRVSRCPACPAFQGFIDTVPQAAQPIEFVDRYRVFCAHPIARRMSHVETD